MHWLTRLFRKDRAEKQLDSELRFHLERQIADYIAAGMPPDDARRRAHLDFGGLESIKQETRESHRANFLDALWQDARFGLRMLRKNPSFTAVAVLTLALGIGANTAMFSVVDAVILRPLPYKDSSRMVLVYVKSAMFPTFNLGLSWPTFQQIRSQASALEQAAVYFDESKILTGRNEPAVLNLSRVSDGFFEELGVRPQLGRLFTAQDYDPGQDHVVVLSDSFWRTRLGADPSILGQTLILDKEPWRVIGVSPPGFSYPGARDGWLPLSLTREEQQNQTYFMLQFIGKLRPGQSIEQLKPELATIAQRIVKDHPELAAGYLLSTIPLLKENIEGIRTAYYMLLGATTLVLLIACANLASLMLVRGSGRRRELALRAALGATDARLFRQGLVESCLLALLGGGLGVIVAAGGVQLYRAIAPVNSPRLAEISVNSTLLWFSLLTSLVAGLLFGIAPARRAARMQPNDALKEGSGAALGSARTARQVWVGNSLVVVEVAFAFVLIIGSALMAQTVSRLLRQDPGFRSDHLLSLDLPQPPFSHPSHNGEPTREQIRESAERLKQILDLVRRVPGVEAAAATSHTVLGGMSMMMGGLQVEGASPSTASAAGSARVRYVYPSYFRVLGIPLVRGREFSERVAESSPSEVMVNKAMARQIWGTLDVLGKRISFSLDGKGKPVWSEIIGVVGDARDVQIGMRPSPEYYLSLLQAGAGDSHLLVRTAGDPQSFAASISHQLWSQFPDQPVSHVTTVTQIIADSVGDQRSRTILLLVFAAVGFALALVGAYGVISFSVSRRVPEIGIRMALGASPGEVLGMVLRQGLLLVSSGIVLGAAASFGLTRLIASQLYGIRPGDPPTYLASAALIFLVACVASFVPARRASRVDPIVALRYE